MRFVVGLFMVTVTGPGPHPRYPGMRSTSLRNDLSAGHVDSPVLVGKRIGTLGQN